MIESSKFFMTLLTRHSSRLALLLLASLTCCWQGAAAQTAAPGQSTTSPAPAEAQLLKAIEAGDLDAVRAWLQGAPSDSLSREQMLAAVRAGRVAICKLMLDHCSRRLQQSFMESDPYYSVPILAEAPNAEVAQFLMEHGAGTDAENGEGRNALIPLFDRGFSRGDVAAVSKVVEILKARKTAESKDAISQLITHVIAQGPAAKVKKLHKLGIDLNVKVRSPFQRRAEVSPLHLVRDAGSAAVLLTLGLDPNTTDTSDLTPVAYLASPSKIGRDPLPTTTTLAILDVLAAHGAKADLARPGMNETPLFAVDDSAVMAWLLAHGADPNHRNVLGRTAITFQNTKENGKNVDLLLAHGAEINARDIAGMTPLLLTVHGLDDNHDRDAFKRVTRLLDRGADAKATANDGETALHLAARADQHQLIKTLIAHGVAPRKTDKLGRTPLHFCLMRRLLDSGLDINQPDRFGQTPLHALAARYVEDTTETRPNWRYSDPTFREQVLELKELRTAYPRLSLKLNATDQAGRTPLHWAALRRQAGLARQLLEAGADPKITDKLGRTPTDEALMSGNQELINLFRAGGARMDENTGRFKNQENHLVNIHQDLQKRSMEKSYRNTTDPTRFEIMGIDLNNDGLFDLLVNDLNHREKLGDTYYIYFGQEDGSFRFATDVIGYLDMLPLDKGKSLLFHSEGRNYWSTEAIDLCEEFQITPFASETDLVGY